MDGDKGSIGIANFFPYNPNLPKEVLLPKGSGICDPLQKNWYARLHPFRYATLALRGALSGADVLFSAQTTTIFDKGPGENGAAPMSDVLTNADTDLAKTGAMVDSGGQYVILGVSVTPMEPWSVVANAAANGSPRVFSTVIASDYGPRALRALAHAFALELKADAANACRYHLGSPGDWGNFWSGQSDGGSPGGVPGVFTMLGVPAVSAGYKDSSQLFVEANLPSGVQINAGATPFPAGRDLIAAFRVYLWGYPVCAEG